MASQWYVGWREDGKWEVRYVKSGPPLRIPLCLGLANHSPDGFAWGYQGSGPAQLALALLVHASGCDNLAMLLYQEFKREVLCRFGQNTGWCLTREQIVQWMADHEFIPVPLPREPGIEEGVDA
jgi:hypothetical protein